MTVEEIQAARGAGARLDDALHLVTQAYGKVSRPEVRAGYNLSIGYATESLATRPLPGRRFWTGNRRAADTDLYEVMGLHETAPPELVAEAYRIMRALYLRLPVTEERRRRLLGLLEQAYLTIGRERSRARYDERRREAARRRAGHQGQGQLAGLKAAWRTLGRLLSPWARGETPAVEPSMLARLNLYLER